MTNIPFDEARTMASEIDRLIKLADSHDDFVLGALLCTARDHLMSSPGEQIPPAA